MDDKSPNLQLNTPNAGDIASSAPTSSSSSILLPSSSSDSVPSHQTDAIVAFSVLATVVVLCVVACVVLTSRGMMVTGMSSLRSMGHYDWHSVAGDVDGQSSMSDRKQWIRVPRLWEVGVTGAAIKGVKSEKRKEKSESQAWDKIMPLSAQVLCKSSKTPRSFPSPTPRHYSNQVRVNVVISMPSPSRCKDEPLAISEYAIGTVDIPMVRSRTPAEYQRRVLA